MNTYTLYHMISTDNINYYCYTYNDDYCSYWQISLADALTTKLTFFLDNRDIYGVENIIYESDQPITINSHPEFFI